MGCRHTTSQNPQRDNNMNVKKTICNTDSYRILSKEEAVNKLGVPLVDTCFVLDDLQGEFRTALNNIFTKEERLSKTIMINECTWEKDKVNNITIWYIKDSLNWFPVDTLIWRKDAEF